MNYYADMLDGVLSFLPSPLARRLHIYRLESAVRAYGSTALSAAVGRVRERADMDRIRRLRRQIRPVLDAHPTSAAKYADLASWLPLNIQRAARLDLHRAPGKRILDLGCGPGYFLAAARALGHESWGIDAPETYFSAIEKQVYSELLEALGCRPYVSNVLIEPFAPLPAEPASFDLVTAFWICFNRHKQPDEWGVAEWRFFVSDAFRILRPGGLLYLELNINEERYGALRWYDAATLDYFRSAGTVEGNRVWIRTAPGAGEPLELPK
jgi:SAM-dependent methyltransferase